MPDLLTNLREHDLSFLDHLAEAWGLSVRGKDQRAIAAQLGESLLNEQAFQEQIETLTGSERQALAELKRQGGSLPWERFTEKFGELRAMGPARREREKPWFFPISTTERLWYLGLIGRSFVRSAGEISEVAYLPEEFLGWLPEPCIEAAAPNYGAELPYSTEPPGVTFEAADQILDESCTLLAALRLENSALMLQKTNHPESYWNWLRQLLRSMGLLDALSGLPNEAARAFLEKPRSEALAWLVKGWAYSRDFQDLRLVTTLKCEGTWQYDALSARLAVLRQLKALPAGNWLALSSFTDFLHSTAPDFLRQGSDYDTWLITRAEPGAPLLRGRASWPEVEGEFLRFLISVPLFHLGLVALGQGGAQDETYFRISEEAATLLDGQVPHHGEEAPARVSISSAGLLEMSALTPRIARYQISRFCEWLEVGPRRFRYRLTPASLSLAKEQGLSARHLVALLRKYGISNPSPALIRAIYRWEQQGGEATIQTAPVLKLASPEILQALRATSAGKYLVESLGPTSVLLKPGSEEKVQIALARLGYLADRVTESE